MSGERAVVDAIDFQIACRRFTVRATMTRDRQLAVVDEYVLRLLAVLERMSVARMRAWFGFSETEIETVLLDLGRRAWVEFDGDDVVLAPAGRDLFRSVGDNGVPHIVEVTPLVGDVWFDLVSRGMVSRSRSRNVDYLPRLREQESARALPETFAREAFEANFRDYARRIRRFPDAENVNLYSISDVHGGGYGYQVLPAQLALDLDRLSVRPMFPELDEVGGFQKLTVAANDAWSALAAPDEAPTTAAEFERMTGDARLAPLIREPVSVSAWRDAMLREPVTAFAPILGASYLAENVSALVERIADARPVPISGAIAWLRPSGSAWGRTLRVAETIQSLREALRNSGAEETSATLVMPRSAHRSVRSLHRRLFDRGILLPQGHLPANLEVLHVPGVAAIVNVHLAVGGTAVPIGGMVTDPKRLARIADRLAAEGVGGREDLWPKAAQAWTRSAEEDGQPQA